MANSFIVGDAKNKIIKELIKDEAIIKGIDPINIGLHNSEKLINKYIFNFSQNPNTIHDVETFITVETNINNRHFGNNRYVDSTVEIWIISHEVHMVVDNFTKVNENRNDYLSRLIDNKFNGSRNIGIGTLELTANIEGSIQHSWLYRRLIFEVIDINNSFCKNR